MINSYRFWQDTFLSFLCMVSGVISKSVSLQNDIPMEEVTDVDPFARKIK